MIHTYTHTHTHTHTHTVHPGGNLDMRFVMMIRPGGRTINNGRTRLIIGGMAFVRLGGNFRGSGCVLCGLHTMRKGRPSKPSVG